MRLGCKREDSRSALTGHDSPVLTQQIIGYNLPDIIKQSHQMVESTSTQHISNIKHLPQIYMIIYKPRIPPLQAAGGKYHIRVDLYKQVGLGLQSFTHLLSRLVEVTCSTCGSNASWERTRTASSERNLAMIRAFSQTVQNLVAACPPLMNLVDVTDESGASLSSFLSKSS